ncbi:MAG: helix-turn-helix domain-containing protein [Anaeroplasmataceae bacterium]|nr:helix-turn-helix domain-containing protein [Anaeroplasmataceae bacterium]
MQKFILLKTNLEYFLWIEDVLKMILGNHSVKEDGDVLQIWFTEGNETEITETLRSLEEDLNTLITFYISSYEDSIEELSLIKPIFLNINHGYYNFKSLLLACKRIDNAKELLDFILNKTGVTEEIILSIAKNDLNASKTSTMLYMHRNTLLYKMERLYQLKSFDLKSFNDVYILIKLIYS